MRSHRIVTVVIAALAALLLGAPSAMANSFDKDIRGGRVWYDDGTDTLCAKLRSGSGYDVMSVDIHPIVAGRGPDRSMTVYRGGAKKCRSLATAYEDTQYQLLGILGYDPPCRCGYRFGWTFYS